MRLQAGDSIQPHGAMLISDPETGVISHASANAQAFLGSPTPLVGATLEAALGQQATHDLRNASARAGGAELSGLLVDIALPGRTDLVDASIHRHKNRIFVELQPTAPNSPTAPNTLDVTHALILRLGRETTVDALASTGAKLLRAMLGYDRVMVYRLLHDGAGRVVAESRKSSLASFMGQHIPQQARGLYLLNSICAIADVQYAPSPILPPLREDEAAIDMSYAQLRGLSSVHCDDMRDMGVAASLSISIIVNGELWGLIACHHDTPKMVPMPLRLGAALFGHCFSLQIALAEGRAQAVTA
jgi:light-regulated signal transduction histidine kinase (bacteriophytochrome)